MTIRRVSYAEFQRNSAFWIKRQARGEEIVLMRLGTVVGVLYGTPAPAVPGPGREVMLFKGAQVIRRNLKYRG